MTFYHNFKVFSVPLLCLILLAAPSRAQTAPSTTTSPTPSTAPVPFLSGQEAISTMNLPKGFHMELVAEETMIEHPVAMSFDADGRMWVVEMRSYMPDVTGTGENTPGCRISILEDTNHDGRADKYTVFLDHLVLPRAVSCIRDGALVAVPPKVFFCRDTNRDGVCDEQTVIATDYGLTGNPEHQPNGLLPALDNWIYSANYDKRIRLLDNKWVSEMVPILGQWGLSQDDFGRLFYNYNSDHLRAAVVPPHYVDRNPYYRGTGANEQIADDQTVWPEHDTAVNRGYRAGFVREDGTLRKFTATCAPEIYRGGIFPPEFEGNAFVCEPSANVIRRDIISEKDGHLKAANAYKDSEFIASSYERFRPVNLYTGPDGALYVIDMHHGLLQHKAYLTPYLRDLYLARHLNEHLGTGRIYRIVPDGAKLYPPPHLSTASRADLVAALSHPNGWWRDTAQRLLVEHGDYRAGPPLRTLATSGKSMLGRLHALWTLDGLRQLDIATLKRAFTDHEPSIRAAAIRLTEPLLSTPRRPEILPALLKLVDDDNIDVRLQFALTTSNLGLPETDAALLKILARDCDNNLIRDAIITGMRGRELPFLERVLACPDFTHAFKGRAQFIAGFSKCLVAEGDPKHIARLLEIVAQQSADSSWRQVPLLEGFPEPPKANENRKPRAIMLESEPTKLLGLKNSTDAALSKSLERALGVVHWPGEPGYQPPPPPPPLTPEQQARFDAGRLVYAATCNQCHRPNGMGQEGLAPPLVDSEWVLGPESRIIRIVLHGLHGPVTVSGRSYSLEMPALATLKDDDIAAAITFVRRSWDHTASPVDPKTVAKIRAETTDRPSAFTERELLKSR